ncbi:hypothetical protein ACE6H2_019892 [Prunus campanulata]
MEPKADNILLQGVSSDNLVLELDLDRKCASKDVGPQRGCIVRLICFVKSKIGEQSYIARRGKCEVPYKSGWHLT